MSQPDMPNPERDAGERGQWLTADERNTLFEAQSVKQCRAWTPPASPGGKPLRCTAHQKWHAQHPHEFDGAITCESCKHMGGVSWPDPFGDKHYCGREKERRADSFRSTGDFSEDFMQEFRKFYDASPRQWAENCKFFEPRELLAQRGKDAL